MIFEDVEDSSFSLRGPALGYGTHCTAQVVPEQSEGASREIARAAFRFGDIVLRYLFEPLFLPSVLAPCRHACTSALMPPFMCYWYCTHAVICNVCSPLHASIVSCSTGVS